MTDSYEIRRYEPADRDGFLALFEEVLGGEMGAEWFAWKYEQNPYVDHVPIVVAERDSGSNSDSELVGARAFFPLTVAAGTDRYDAFQPCDSMVHPDHQRQGIFTRMTERALEWYDDVDLFFNFPNHRSLPGNLELGWEIVSTQETYYRVQNPAIWLSQPWPVESVARALARGYTSVRDRLADSTGGFDVVRHDHVPPTVLSMLAGSETVSQFHVVRDETFYEWRFENPHWSYRTVVATHAETPVAAVVYGRRERTSGSTTVRIVDVLPLADTERSLDSNSRRTAALSRLLDDILRTNEDADVVVAPGGVIPRSVLNARGFHSDSRAPLRWISSSSTHVVRPAGANPSDWTRSGRRLTDESNWRLALCEVDSA
ncbi:GNAT family N-acetyltransferase [Halobacteria archaeon AArc-m2/3/4]|uniref:GNAT family N-acetyltransferase n=1 Tax=Natronoglomus mannanivorans TaxID=2979990 RepID=A0ABT2QGZ1_9EURY|nr:GNAT family N-acetyltransferase [Halobacteria archaeon AArc-m2/3/4]